VQAEALIRELHSIIQNDRYPFSPRIVALKEILSMLRPERRSRIANHYPAEALRAAQQGTISETTWLE
jgi:hypothetical protein